MNTKRFTIVALVAHCDDFGIGFLRGAAPAAPPVVQTVVVPQTIVAQQTSSLKPS